jgi:hypothetical protein
MGSDRRIAAARKIEPVVRDRDTDEELPPTSRDTWPGELDTDVRNDTIPTPPPSSGMVEHVTIPQMPAVKVDDQS